MIEELYYYVQPRCINCGCAPLLDKSRETILLRTRHAQPATLLKQRPLSLRSIGCTRRSVESLDRPGWPAGHIGNRPRSFSGCVERTARTTLPNPGRRHMAHSLCARPITAPSLL